MNARASGDAGGVSAEVGLSRSLGLFTVTMMGVGGMIGAGIFALTGIAVGQAGPAVIVVFVANGVITLLTALAYAELGAAFPRAGGGFVWVKEGLGGANGFLAGWMSWAGYIVAGALYGIAFGGFAANAWAAMGLPFGGLSPQALATVATVAVIALFTGLNVIGAEETGAMGAVVTVIKIVILVLFIGFGLVAMGRMDQWQPRFFHDFMPNGVRGVMIGMGLTFIAFEGYEIIAQSGEEIIEPARNVPRGIFLSIAIATLIYILVGIVAIGATTPPPGMDVPAYLGQKRELAIVSVARQIFPFGVGGGLMLISGLAATISALNVTIFSGARVSFAMAREHNLPPALARVHPRLYTPYLSVLVTGALMLAAALVLPIEIAATAGGVMFLLMFIQVNVVLIGLRHDRPEIRRGFRVPLFPLTAVVAIAANAALVLFVVSHAPVAAWTAFGWVVAGLLAYFMYFEHHEALEKPSPIVLEETIGHYRYTVLIAVRDRREAKVLGWFGAMLAKAHDGGVLATHILEVPRLLSLGEATRMVKTGRHYFDPIVAEAKRRGVGVHSLIMVSRRAGAAIAGIAADRRADHIVIAWNGKSRRGRMFGRTNDALLAGPPADIAVVRPAARMSYDVKTVLVPVDEGADSRRALALAVAIARLVAGRAHARITLLHVTRGGAAAEAGAKALFQSLVEGIDYRQIETKAVAARSVANTVIEEAKGHDLVIFGAGDTGVFRRLLAGSTARRILRHAQPTTVMVKRRQGVLGSLLRRALPPPK